MNGLGGVLTELQAFRTELSGFIAGARETRAGLAALKIDKAPDDPEKYEIGILIPSRLVDDKLGPLADELEDWNKILRAFAELAGEVDHDLKVNAIVSDSYLLAVLCTYGTAQLVATTVQWIADLYMKILQIRELRLKLEKLDASTPEIPVVKAHEEKLVGESIEALVVKLLDQSQTALNQERRNEVSNELTIRIRHVVRFVDRGGAVEVNRPIGKLDPEQDGADAAGANARRDIQILGAAIASLPARKDPILSLPDAAPTETEQPETTKKT